MKVIIDRFEGEYGIVELEDMTFVEIPRVLLDNAKEGDNVGEIKIFYDKHLIKTLKLFTMNKIDKLLNKLVVGLVSLK